MADRGQCGTKRLSDLERMEWLKKTSKIGNRGKGIVGSSNVALPSKVVAPSPAPVTRPSDRPEVRSGRPREDRPVIAVSTSRSRQEDLRPRDLIPPTSGVEPTKRTSLVHEVLVSKFGDKLTLEVVESSRHSDHIDAIGDCVEKLIEVSSSCRDLLGMLIH